MLSDWTIPSLSTIVTIVDDVIREMSRENQENNVKTDSRAIKNVKYCNLNSKKYKLTFFMFLDSQKWPKLQRNQSPKSQALTVSTLTHTCTVTMSHTNDL